jgi:hypothetical protein
MSVVRVTEPLVIQLDRVSGSRNIVDADGIAWATGIIRQDDAEKTLERIRREQAERDAREARS